MLSRLFKLKLTLIFFITVLFSNTYASDSYVVHFSNGSFTPPPNRGVLDHIALQEMKLGGYLVGALQFDAIPTEKTKMELRQIGVFLGDYIKHNAYTVMVPEEVLPSLPRFGVRSLFAIPDQMKVDRELLSMSPDAEVVAWLYHHKQISIVDDLFLALRAKDFQVEYAHDAFNLIVVKFHMSRLDQLKKFKHLVWITNEPPENESYNLPGFTNHRANILGSTLAGFRGLSGKNVIIGEWDGAGVGPHIDYDDRLTNVQPFVNNLNGQHATHVCGTFGGAGNLNPFARGMAPDVTVFAWDFMGNVPMEMDTGIVHHPFVITQNSFGYTPAGDPCTVRGRYDINSYGLDVLVNREPHLLHVFANGNSRSSNCIAGGYRTVGSGYQSAKNILTVGAVTGADQNSTFHSYGPTLDGRIKPDVCGVGVSVFSTFPNNTYQGGWNGTSMACPGVSGTAALLYELYRDSNANVNPYFHTLKAALCNTARDLGRKGPDFIYGYGAIDGDKAAQVLEKKLYLVDSLTHGDSLVKILTVGPNTTTEELRIFLCWRDVPALSSTGTALVNDLDLFVITPNGDTILPLVPDFTSVTANAVQRLDTLNTNEQVVIDNPVDGDYKIVVLGRVVPNGKPDFTLTWWEFKPQLKLIYPLGGEQWRPPSNAASAQLITWEAFGLPGTFSVEFSADSGLTWQTLVANLPNNTSAWLWNNASPSLYTNKGFIRVVLTDATTIDVVHQLPIVIMPHPQINGPDAIVCAERLTLFWNPSPHAAQYAVYQLLDGKMKVVGSTRDTFFVVKNLVNDSNYWFALSVIDVDAAEGPRSLAKMHRPSGIDKGPEIVTQPFTVPYCAGEHVVLYSQATGADSMFSRWEWSADSAQNWDTLGNAFVVDSLLLNPIITFYNSLYLRNAYYNHCGGFEYTDTLQFVVDSIIDYTLTPQLNLLCEGQNALFEANPVSFLTPAFFWERSTDNGVTWDSLAATESQLMYAVDSVLFPLTGQLFRMHAANTCGVFVSDSAPLIVRPPLSLSMANDTIICTGQQAPIFALGSGGDTLNHSYLWEPTGESTSQISANPDSSLYYKVTFFDACSPLPLVDSVWVQRRLPLTAMLTVVDTTICIGSEISLAYIAEGGLEDSIRFTLLDGTPSIGSETFAPATSGYYGFIATDNCSQEVPTDSIWIDFYDPLSVSIDPVDTLCVGQSVVLQAVASGGLPGAHLVQWENDPVNQLTFQVNPGVHTDYFVSLTDGCTVLGDTASITVLVRDTVRVELIAPTEVCFGENVTLQTITTGGIPADYTYTWNPLIAASNAIENDVPAASQWYYVMVDDLCSQTATDSAWVVVNPLPHAVLSVLPNPVCQHRNLAISFTNLHPYSFTNTELQLGNAAPILNQQSISYQFANAGFVDIAIDMEDQNGCVSDTVLQQFIEVVAMPIPDFTFNPSVPTIDNPRVEFTHKSQFFQDLFWTFGEGTSGMSASESVLYPDTGWYPVTLIATNRLGCDSSVTKMVRIFDVYKAFIPNAFSPNDNRLNETWVPFIRAVQSYELKIFNRWGELILETSNPLLGWNGKYHNTGDDLQEGVYVYTISVIDIHGERHKEKGTVFLMR